MKNKYLHPVQEQPGCGRAQKIEVKYVRAERDMARYNAEPQASGDFDEHMIIRPVTQRVHIHQIMQASQQPWQVDKAGPMTVPNR